MGYSCSGFHEFGSKIVARSQYRWRLTLVPQWPISHAAMVELYKSSVGFTEI